jgi:hypothetical protein
MSRRRNPPRNREETGVGLPQEGEADRQAERIQPGVQVSSKSGKASSAEKEEATRHGFDAAPATSPVAGAFGKSRRKPAPAPTGGAKADPADVANDESEPDERDGRS